MWCLPACAAAAIWIGAAQPAQAPAPPETRADALRREREAKNGRLSPHDPNPLEQALTMAERQIVPFLQRDGFYGKFGSLSTGSGFAYGGGFRDRSLVAGRGEVDVWAAGSIKKYWALDFTGRYPLARGDRVGLFWHARKFAYTEEEFTGIGPDSARADRTAYSLRGTDVGLGARVRLTGPFAYGGGLDVQRPALGAGGGTRWPSIETVFDDGSAPGLAGVPRFVRTWAFAEVDYRRPLNARRGGYYRVDVSRVRDSGGGAYAFSRVDIDLRQYVSFLAERRVLAARLVGSTTEADAGARVPFFLLPALGGNDTLRGFRALRFRGPHRLLLQAEYRWEVWSGLEAALFTDWGKVALRRSDLSFRDLERDYGFGFRFNTDTGVVVRVDAAFGSRDGRHLHIVFGGFF
jgi:hypothetical protein